MLCYYYGGVSTCKHGGLNGRHVALTRGQPLTVVSRPLHKTALTATGPPRSQQTHTFWILMKFGLK
jgi:hypothetical protein